MNAFKTIRRVGAISLLVYGIYKVGGCGYRTYETFKEQGVATAMQAGLSEMGRYVKESGQRLEEMGSSLEKIKPAEEEQGELEKQLE